MTMRVTPRRRSLSPNERGHVDVDHIAEILHADADAVIAELGNAIYRDPESGSWQTADAYLSGQVREKLKSAEAAAALDLVGLR